MTKWELGGGTHELALAGGRGGNALIRLSQLGYRLYELLLRVACELLVFLSR